MTKKTKTGDDGVTPGGPGVNTIIKRNRDGSIRSVYYYHRATGIRLTGTPGTPEYAKSLKAAERAGRAPAVAKPRKHIGVWSEIIDAYQRSLKYKKLAETTRVNYDSTCRDLINKFGWMTKKDVENRRVRSALLELRDDVAGSGRPSMADHYIKVARMLLGFAYDRAMIDYNHAIGIERVGANRPRAHITFSPEIRSRVINEAHPDVAVAFQLAMYTAARLGDLCQLEWSMLGDDGWLVFKPAKTAHTTGVIVQIPVFALEPLDSLIGRLPREGERILLYHGDRGARPWTTANLAYQWEQFRNGPLGRPDLHWHDLRGTAVSEMLKAGCTNAEVASITGHAIGAGSEIGTYADRSRELALGAFTKWNRALTGKGRVVQLRRRQASKPPSETP